MLHLHFQLSEEEYFAFNYYTAWSAPERRKYRVVYYLRVLLLYAAVAGLYIFSNRNHNLYIDIGVFAAIALVYLALIPVLVKRSVRRRARQILSQPENKHILEPCEVLLTDTGLIDKDRESETRYSWEAIVKKAETPDCFYLYTNSYHAIVIPKRSLGTGKDRQELKRLLDAHLPLGADFATL